MMSLWFSVAPVVLALLLGANGRYFDEFHITGVTNEMGDKQPNTHNTVYGQHDNHKQDNEISSFFDITELQAPLSSVSPSDEETSDDGTTDSNNEINVTEDQIKEEETPNAYEDIIEDIAKHENWRLLNLGDKCGQGVRYTDKVIGGQNADMGAYPWMARLIYRSFRKDTERGGCGGSIINNHYILTAAHCCFDDRDQNLVMIRVGEYDIHHVKDCFRGKCAPHSVDYGIESVTKHQLFGKNGLMNDICLIRTFEKIEFNDYVRPICLPVSANISKWGRQMTVAGWGQTESLPDGRLPEVLQETEVRVLSPFDCYMRFHGMVNPKTQVCAGGAVGHDVCAGDSGGPLMFRVYSEDVVRHYIYGLVSFGAPCNHQDDEPVIGVYTKITAFLTWILDTIEG